MSFDENITKEEVEQCKQKDLLEELMKEMAGEFPAFGEVFVNERDLYLCYSLQMASMHAKPLKYTEPVNIVGVFGIGHCAGIKKIWNKEGIVEEIPKIMIIPKAKLSTRIFKNTVKYGTLGYISYQVGKLLFGLVKRIK